MSTWYFPHSEKMRFPGGEFDILFVNDDGDLTTTTVNDALFLKIADMNEPVEEDGIGGVILVSDMELEVYDKGNIFSGTIFNRANITNCQARILVYMDGETDPRCVIRGSVDLSTVSYPSYYDDEAGTEAHSCKFTIFSLIRALEDTGGIDLQTELDALKVDGTLLDDSKLYRFVKVTDVFTVLQSFLYANRDTFVHNIAQSFRVVGPDTAAFPSATQDFDFDHIWLAFEWQQLPMGSYTFKDPFQDAGATGSFLSLQNCRAILMQLAGMFLAYPIVFFDPATDKVHIDLRQRGTGSLVDTADLTELLEAEQGYALGHDGIKITSPYGANADIFYPAATRDAQYRLAHNGFEFQSYFNCHANGSGDDDPYDLYLYAQSTVDSTKFKAVSQIVDGSTVYNRYFKFLRDNFARFWGEQEQVHRTYRGPLLGALNDLDRLVVSGKNYTVVEMRRKILEDKTEVRAVLY